MSGGSMSYVYSKLEMEIPSLEYIQEHFDENTPEETKQLALKAKEKLEEAVKIAKRLEWWLSCDDGHESFVRRMKQDLGYNLLLS